MLAELVRFDTTSRDGNIPLIAFVESYLDGWDIPHFRVDYEAGKKTNLFATIGPDIAGGIVLSGHTDVVPVDGQKWASNPFELTERDNRLYGRGTCDMKGFIAVALALVPKFKATNLKTPIHLALSCDEEVGCKGVRPLVAHIRDHMKKPKAVIVGEPTHGGATTPGLIAYTDDGRAVGWARLSPRSQLGWLNERFVGRLPVDDDLCSLSCFYVPNRECGAGVMTALIAAATKVARREGVTLEAYPVDPAADKATRNRFTGVLGPFLRAGFTEVQRLSPDRAVVRFMA